MKKSMLFVMLVCFSSISVAETPGTDWSKPYFTRLDVTFSSVEFHARWDISRCDCGDIQIVAEETLPEEIRKGEVLLIDNEVLLTRGYETYDGPLPALIDSPMLMMQLLFILLHQVAPDGTPVPHSTLEISIEEGAKPLMLDSGIAYGAFPAPWSASGRVVPTRGGEFRYELDFKFGHSESEQQGIHLSGLLDYRARDFPIEDSMVLDGWSAAWLDLNTENREGMTPGMTLGKFKEGF
jgi:hypothetical protein